MNCHKGVEQKFKQAEHFFLNFKLFLIVSQATYLKTNGNYYK